MITIKEQEKLLELIFKYSDDYADFMYCGDDTDEVHDKAVATENEMKEYIRNLTFTAQIGE